MSLVGNLEDLSLVEILQIVSLSKKSGTLTLRSRDREAAIVFRCGQVVRASSSMFPQSLGELLTRSAVIDPTILRKALALQQAEGFLERLGSILVKHFNISQEIIEDVVRNQVERVIMSLFEWTSGSFDFQIQDLVETVYDTRMDPLQFMLAQGLNPQYLAMEGMQAMDDKREAIARGDYDNKEEYDEDTGEIEAADAGLLTPDAKKQPLVVVDDDAPTLQAVATVMRELGHQVVAMSRSEDALIKIDGLIREGARPTILIDLIMPKMDGSGVLGGIELMELLHNNFKNLRMIVMTDYQHADAEAKVLERGYLYLLKPRRAEIGKPEQVKEFAGRLQSELQRIQGLMGASNQPERYNLGDDLRLELDDDVSGIGFLGDSSVTEAPTLLKCMLDELENSDQQGGGSAAGAPFCVGIHEPGDYFHGARQDCFRCRPVRYIRR